MKAKSESKLEGKLRGRQGMGEAEDIRASVPSLQLAWGLPYLSPSVIKSRWEGYRGDCPILSVGEGTEDTVKGTYYAADRYKEQEIGALQVSLNLESANYSQPRSGPWPFCKASFSGTQPASSFYLSIALTDMVWPAKPRMFPVWPFTEKSVNPDLTM